MKKSILLSTFLCLNLFLFAQKKSTEDLEKKDFGITFNYFGELSNHSGFEIGMESSIFKNLVVAYHIGFYFVEKNRTDVSLYWDLGYRKTFKNGYSPDVKIGIGYLTTYIPVSETDRNTSLEIVYMPSITLGLLGFDFKESSDVPLRIFGNVMFYRKEPIGGGGENNIVLQVGATFFFK